MPCSAARLAPFAVLLALATAAAAQPQVPDAPRVDSSDTYFGTVVEDPYRWLEHYDQPEVRVWYAAEDAAARAFLGARPAQAQVLQRLADARAERPYTLRSYAEAGGRLVALKRLPDAQSAALYVRDAFSGERLLLAPERVAPGAVLREFLLSPTGEAVAVKAAVAGNERAPVWTVVETATGRVLDELPPRAAVAAWLPDGRRLLYSVYREAGADATSTESIGGLPVLVHTLGTDARTAPDPVAFDAAAHGGDARSIAFAAAPTPGTDVAFVAWAYEDSDRWDATFAAPLAGLRPPGPQPALWRPVSVAADSVIGVFARGASLYAVSFRGTATGRLVRLPMPAGFPGGDVPDWTRAETVVPPGGVDFWQQPQRVAYASDAVYTVESAPGRTTLFRTTYDGTRAEIAAPFEGSFEQPVASALQPGVDVFFSGWTEANQRYHYSPATGRLGVMPAFYNPPDPYGRLDGLTAETVFAPSHDGVDVPLTILRVPAAAGLAAPRPTILTGYASYGLTEDPYFRAQYRPWLEAGGQVAICHARGSGYYGPAWHDAGSREAKPNTWLDGVACAEHLVRSGLTTPARLGISGASAGGIFAGRAVEARPDLFGAAVTEVGWSDMVRLSTGSVGPSNEHEFGTPATEAGFRALLAMSAYEHVDDGTPYPAMLLYAAFNDSRVAPWHPAKLAAALRHAGGAAALPGGARPVLLRVDFEAGHGLADTVASREARLAAVLAFFADRLGLDLSQRIGR